MLYWTSRRDRIKMSIQHIDVTTICLLLTCVIWRQVLIQASVILPTRGNTNLSVSTTEQNTTIGEVPWVNSSDIGSSDTVTRLITPDDTNRANNRHESYEHMIVSSSLSNSESSIRTITPSEVLTPVVSDSDGTSTSTTPLATSGHSSDSTSTVHSSSLSKHQTTTTTSTVTTTDHGITENITSMHVTSSSSSSILSSRSTPTTVPRSFVPLPRVVINEIHVNYTDWLMGDYIELKGAPNVKLDSYQLVLYGGDGGTSYLDIPLDGFITSDDGLFLIGDQKLNSQLTMPIKNILLQDESLHGLALFDGRSWGQTIPNGSHATSKGLLDVLVYAKSELAMGQEILNLTLGFPRIILDPSLMGSEVSISRCTCCSAFNSLQYRVTIPTPGSANKCNLTNERRIQLSLKGMPCDVVRGHEHAMLHTITNMIVHSLQRNCHCGVTSAYLQDAKFSCRKNIIYEAKLRTPSDTHLKLLWRHYKSFVKETASVVLSGVTYTVDSNCFDNCGYMEPPGPTSGLNKTLIGAVAGCLAVFVVIVGIVVFHIRRRRDGLQHFRLTLFRASRGDEAELKMEDVDDDGFEVYSVSGDAAFNNPWYFHLKQTAKHED